MVLDWLKVEGLMYLIRSRSGDTIKKKNESYFNKLTDAKNRFFGLIVPGFPSIKRPLLNSRPAVSGEWNLPYEPILALSKRDLDLCPRVCAQQPAQPSCGWNSFNPDPSDPPRAKGLSGFWA
ncbi:hypothetical protein JTE90_017285 [Oedothorax gibbosus]|uniref:Uncharacterized protein n=1 Tax=Oedothorax gibbosus TaxID=931172 RepID=A0AAV6VFP6_9ARAC|nr:hypothetical protein JTE90_017285 [Oedothorax gibbosus]